MDSLPAVSVVIPVWNVEAYIAPCLESVLSQSLRNIEVICVDDCGTDSSMAVVERITACDGRVRIVRHRRNRGLGPARNTGMSAARGRYIAFLDSDDLMPEDALEHLYAAACETGADITLGQGDAFADHEEAWMQERRDLVRTWVQRKTMSGAVYGLERFEESLHCCHCVAWGKLFSREFLRRNRLAFIRSGEWHEDVGFHIKVMSCFPRMTIIEEHSSMRRVRAGSITTQAGEEVQARRKRDCYAVARDAVRYIRWRHPHKKAEQLIEVLRNKYWGVYVREYDKEYAENMFRERLHKRLARLLGRP